MEYCAPLGIPHSHFLTWSQEDRSKAISYTAWKARICPYCGTVPADWLDAEGTAKEPVPYVAVTHRCLGCATLEDARAMIPKEAQHGTQYRTFLMRATVEDTEQWQMKRST